MNIHSHAQMIKIIKSYVGKEIGGLHIDQMKTIPGFGCRVHSHKIVNGYRINVTETFPGPFDSMVGLSAEISTEIRVWVGWEEMSFSPDYDQFSAPPAGVYLPALATGWSSTAFDGPVNWFAVFPDLESAELYASSAMRQPDEVDPWTR